MADTGTLSALLEKLGTSRVVCVGDIMLDRFIEGRADRLSPEAPIPVIGVERETEIPGGAGNVVRNIATLGAEAALISVIGKDDAGGNVQSLVDDTPRLSATLIAEENRPTTIKTRYLAAGQQLLRADRESTSPIEKKSANAVLAAAKKELPKQNGVLVLSDYGKGVLADDIIADLIQVAQERGALVVVDPKGTDYSRYRGADLLTPNRQELSTASGMAVDSDEEVIAAARQIIKTSGAKAVLATRSEQGMSLVTADAAEHLPARAREVFDVSGAGDSVAAAVAAALGAGAELPVAAAFANIAAGVVVGKIGTAVVYPSEVLSALHESALMGTEAKVAALAGAQDMVATWRRQELRCGFTNGCFDLLHPGHISLLAQAREACDRLIVGLNSDRSVRQLKGPERPVQTESSRAQVLASLASVDLVVIFDEETPLALIEALRPDLLVKGADYALDEVVGGELVSGWGGEVMLADILDGHSTTGTIAKLEAGSKK
ncbi:MAG: bifunctional heptose 7-phosphate kinase/heptose 1-phosphate adenyltransferase [Rhodospirillaceae bacterium]|nr:bifunctional heptose 7-phosphate kinase/heptose 1-phosphate adenyltransferase [Rhodospirillaceae bacterium]